MLPHQMNHIHQAEAGESTSTLVSALRSEPWLELQLRDAEREKKPFDEEDAIHILHDMCRALPKLHHCGVAHGNLTPFNIIRDEKGDIQLLGLHSIEDTNIGFNAPEVRVVQPSTLAADIWCLGAIFYRMLTLITDPPDKKHLFPRELQVSKRVKQLVKQMLRKDPKKRPNVDDVIVFLSKPTTSSRRLTLLMTRLRRTFRNGLMNALLLQRDAADKKASKQILPHTAVCVDESCCDSVDASDEDSSWCDVEEQSLVAVVFTKDGAVYTSLCEEQKAKWTLPKENVIADGKGQFTVHQNSCFVPLNGSGAVVVDAASRKTYCCDNVLRGRWSRVSDAPHRCHEASGIQHGDIVYVIGCSKDSGGKSLGDVLMRFNVTTRTWLSSVKLLQPTCGSVTALCSNWVLVIGGSAADGQLIDMIQCMDSNERWFSQPLQQTLPTLHQQRRSRNEVDPNAAIISHPNGVYKITCLASPSDHLSQPEFRADRLGPSFVERKTDPTSDKRGATEALSDKRSATGLSSGTRSMPGLSSGMRGLIGPSSDKRSAPEPSSDKRGVSQLSSDKQEKTEPSFKEHEMTAVSRGRVITFHDNIARILHSEYHVTALPDLPLPLNAHRSLVMVFSLNSQ